MMTGISEKRKVETLTLPEFISAKSTDAEYCSAFKSFGRPITCINVNSIDVLVQVSRIDCASHRVVLTSFLPRFLQLGH